MTDDKESDDTDNAEGDNNEEKIVEVEVVEAEASDENSDDKEEAETPADEAAAVIEEPDASPAPVADRSPGLILFGFFVVAALAIFALFRFTGGDKSAETPSAEIASVDESAVAAIGADPVEDPTPDAAQTATDATSASPASAVQQDNTSNSASEEAADLFAADPTDDVINEENLEEVVVETQPVDPRAAIAALKREAEQTAETPELPESTDDTAATADPTSAETKITETTLSPEEASTIETAADIAAPAAPASAEAEGAETALSPEEATAIAQEEATEINEAPVDSDMAAVETNAVEEAEPASAEILNDVETSDQEVAVEDDAAEEVVTENLAAEEEALATQGRSQLSQKDFSNFSAAVPENADKIANELESLKETLRQETDALSAAVSEGRELTEQQSGRITELRQSLEQALAERDERANTEIAELRSRVDKIQSGSAQIPAGRQAAASLALLSLQRAVDEGTPYTEELNVLERLTPDAAMLNGLRTSSSTGAPTLASLKAQFKPAIRQALAASDENRASGLLGRIQNLISVRPAAPQAGDRPEQIISRAEHHLEKDDLGNTVRELNALTGNSAEAFSDWRTNAQKRLDASNAIEELNSALLSEYGQ